MNSKKMKELRSRLDKRRNELMGIKDRMMANNQGVQSESEPTELSNYDNHPAEIATELFQVEFNKGLLHHNDNSIREVENAIKKIDEDRYGICELCGEPIEDQRLETIPYARLCIDCEREKDTKFNEAMKTRPVEEEVMDSNMGRKYLNAQEDDEHEGTDILNDLMKYGSADSPQDLGGYHDYENFYTNDEDNQGIVDHMDNISNETYKKSLE
ncbi:MAG: TraR/DksA C4-type zinc finger protein [Eubacteriales bacterium]|nr:TraR/DksA C4-type zinc finger protein [Eubacteriales bacterium]